MLKSTGSFLSIFTLALGLVNCGSSDVNSPSFKNEPQSADVETEPAPGKEKPRDELIVPPKEYYDALFERTISELDTYNLADSIQILYVNFGGATITKGYGSGQSFIPCKNQSTIPTSGLNPTDQGNIIQMVQDFYDDASADILVVDQMPATGPFTTIHTGGSYSDLGCRGGGVLGVAPYDRGNANLNDIGFAFTKGVSSNLVVAETIAHEAGHSFGLNHINNSAGLMYASSSPNIEGFRSGRVSGSANSQDSGEMLRTVLGTNGAGNPGSAPTASLPTPATGQLPTIPGIGNLPGATAGLPGLGQISGIAGILPGIGSGGLPDISNIIPQISSIVPGGGSLSGLPDIMSIIGAAGFPGAGAGGSPLPFDISQATSILGGQAGLGGIDLSTLAGLGGGSGGGGILAQITGMLGGGTAQVPGSLSAVPDLSQLLGIVGGGLPGGLGGAPVEVSSLIGSLRGSAAVVNSNFSNPQTQASLRTLLTVGYSQAYSN
jgi:hypothetical protein